MDRTGATVSLWFCCMLYVAMLLNFTTFESLGWITPHQVEHWSGVAKNKCYANLLDFGFILKDKREVPIKTKVIEVNEDTGKILLKYMHRRLELVETTIVWKALISRN
eukprot:11013227-Ditylum_brightwellii.AAC.1